MKYDQTELPILDTNNISSILAHCRIQPEDLSEISKSMPEDFYREKEELMGIFSGIFQQDNSRMLMELADLGVDFNMLFSLDFGGVSFSAATMLENCIDKNAYNSLAFLKANGVALDKYRINGNNLLLYALTKGAVGCCYELLNTAIDTTELGSYNNSALYYIVAFKPDSYEESLFGRRLYPELFEDVYSKMKTQLNYDTTCYGAVHDKDINSYLYGKNAFGQSPFTQICERNNTFIEEVNYNSVLSPTAEHTHYSGSGTWLSFLASQITTLKDLQRLDTELKSTLNSPVFKKLPNSVRTDAARITEEVIYKEKIVLTHKIMPAVRQPKFNADGELIDEPEQQGSGSVAPQKSNKTNKI